jgi:hypothetical protein
MHFIQSVYILEICICIGRILIFFIRCHVSGILPFDTPSVHFVCLYYNTYSFINILVNK